MKPRETRPIGSSELAFWAVAYVFTVAMVGNTLPTPLYVIYQSRWHFSSGIVTLIFATYAAGVLAALLFAGRVSDHVGRRPILALVLALSALSAIVFIWASGPGGLFVGRALSGLSAGLVTGTATAALTELVRDGLIRRASIVATSAATGGLGLGPVVAGALAQFSANPTILVFQVYLGLLAGGALTLIAVPETVESRQPLSLRFQGLRVPDQARAQFFAAGMAGFAALALMGLYSALAPSFLANLLGVKSPFVGGLVVFLIFALSTLTQIGLGRYRTDRIIRLGLGILILALVAVVAALSRASMPLLLIAAVIGGVAVGATFIGSLATANRLSPPEIRGQVISTYFTFAYLGLTLPIIAVGFMADRIGFLKAVLIAGVGLAVLSVTAMITGRKEEVLP